MIFSNSLTVVLLEATLKQIRAETRPRELISIVHMIVLKYTHAQYYITNQQR